MPTLTLSCAAEICVAAQIVLLVAVVGAAVTAVRSRIMASVRACKDCRGYGIERRARSPRSPDQRGLGRSLWTVSVGGRTTQSPPTTPWMLAFQVNLQLPQRRETTSQLVCTAAQLISNAMSCQPLRPALMRLSMTLQRNVLQVSPVRRHGLGRLGGQVGSRGAVSDVPGAPLRELPRVRWPVSSLHLCARPVKSPGIALASPSTYANLLPHLVPVQATITWSVV